jgi:integrase
MQTLRFHALRLTFGTLAAQGFDLVNVQAMMGHADSRTHRALPARTARRRGRCEVDEDLRRA